MLDFEDAGRSTWRCRPRSRCRRQEVLEATAVLTATTTSISSGAIAGIVVVAVIVAVLEIAGTWRVYTKAGQHGWASIIPFYNIWVLLKIVGRPGWWLVLFLIPLVNIITALVVLYDLCLSFGKTAAFLVGLFFLGFIFYPILGFGAARYLGPAGDPSVKAAAGAR